MAYATGRDAGRTPPHVKSRIINASEAFMSWFGFCRRARATDRQEAQAARTRLFGGRQFTAGEETARLGGMAEVDYFAIHASVRGFFIAQGMIMEEQYDQAHAQARAELASGMLTCPFYIAYSQK